VLPDGHAFQPQNESVGCDDNFECVRSNDADGSYVRSLQTGGGPREDLYTLSNPTPRAEPIAAVRLNIVARSVTGGINTNVVPKLAIPNNPSVSGLLAALGPGYGTVSTTFFRNPFTDLPWAWDEIPPLRAGVALSVSSNDEGRVTFVSVDVCWAQPTPTPTITPTTTITPTVTATRTPTRTPTRSLTPTLTATLLPTATPTLTETPSVTPTLVVTSTPTPTSTPTSSATAIPTETVTPTETLTPVPPSETPSPTATGPTDTPTVTPTPSPSVTLSASPTLTQSPTITGTRPTATATALPRVSYLIGRGDNEWQCAFDLQSGPPLLLSSGTTPMGTLAAANPEMLRSIYQAIYIAPGLSLADYELLRLMSALGGSIEQFVTSGGVAVINLAGSQGDQINVAPGGVGFGAIAQHEAEDILLPDHPYITGMGLGGEALAPADFSNWAPSDYGVLTNLPPNASIILANTDGPTWAEYNYGAGRVIVTSVAYCFDDQPSSQGAATRNLFRYGRFFQGSAQTPAATVTVTPTFTPTSSRTPTRTRTPTATGSPVNTPTPTPIPGDVNDDGVVDELDLPALLDALFGDAPQANADVNGDGTVSVADVTALLVQLGDTF